MKYFIAVIVTAIIVFAGSYIFFKGLPAIPAYNNSPVSTESAVTVASPGPSVVPSALPSPGASGFSTQTADENISIVSSVQQGLISEHGQDAASMNITISKVEGDYAKGMASAQGGGGIWFAAKVGGAWKLVWDGNGSILCSDIASYPNFPKDMIPDCWDASTNKDVTR